MQVACLTWTTVAIVVLAEMVFQLMKLTVVASFMMHVGLKWRKSTDGIAQGKCEWVYHIKFIKVERTARHHTKQNMISLPPIMMSNVWALASAKSCANAIKWLLRRSDRYIVEFIETFWSQLIIKCFRRARSTYNSAHRRMYGFDKDECKRDNKVLALTLWTHFMYPDCQTTKKLDSCCGQVPYNSARKICCDGQLHRANGEMACCGANVMKKHETGCCNGQTYQLG